jgi:hypothetical protein
VSAPEEKRVLNLPGETVRSPADVKAESVQGGPGHSDIFERLSAHDESDLVGLVAYGLYQRRKRAWIRDFQAKFGRYPNQEERDGYSFTYREGGVIALRNEAEGTLAAFGERLVEEQIDALRADALSLQTQAVLTGIDTKIDKVGSYWHHIVGHLAGFVILVGLVALSSWIVTYEPSLEKVRHWLYGSAPVQTKAPSGPPSESH